jgi:hypothetical protein
MTLRLRFRVQAIEGADVPVPSPLDGHARNEHRRSVSLAPLAGEWDADKIWMPGAANGALHLKFMELSLAEKFHLDDIVTIQITL